MQNQAKAVLEEANLNKELHHIACNFKKVPGKIYYVYRREESGAKYMSMISPEVSILMIIRYKSIFETFYIYNVLQWLYYKPFLIYFTGMGRKLPFV